MKSAYHVTSVEYLGGYRLRIGFADGLIADVDLAAKLRGKVGPVFEPLRDKAFFAHAAVDDELGTVVWPNGADLAPDVLHEEAVSVA